MKTLINLLIVVCMLLGVVKAQDTATGQASNVLVTRLDSSSYALGFSIANDLKSRGITTLNYPIFIRAMQEVIGGVSPLLNLDQCQQLIVSAFTEAKKRTSEPLIAEANRFLDENKRRKGVFTTASGLQYEILKPAKAAQPKASDEVTVHYKGTLTNGSQFDSSYDRNEPAKFVLNQVIPGWTEGVQLMSVGSKYRFYIPYQLAYGENGVAGAIPPYSVLIFEVELIKIGE